MAKADARMNNQTREAGPAQKSPPNFRKNIGFGERLAQFPDKGKQTATRLIEKNLSPSGTRVEPRRPYFASRQSGNHLIKRESAPEAAGPCGRARTRKKENGCAPLISELPRAPRGSRTTHHDQHARLLREGCPTGVGEEPRRRQPDGIKPRSTAIEQLLLRADGLLLRRRLMSDIQDNRQFQLS